MWILNTLDHFLPTIPRIYNRSQFGEASPVHQADGFKLELQNQLREKFCSVLFAELKPWPIHSHETITLIFRYTNIFTGFDFGWLPCY